MTIARDEWGVPHIFGDTDAQVAFGLGFAQAEDGYRRLEEVYLHALGRASHWYGEQYLAADLARHAFEVARLAREEYEREPPQRRVIWDAFAAGINYYIRTAGVRPRLITRFEPWMPFALVRAIDANTPIDGVRLDAIAADASDRANAVPPDAAHGHSLAWAVRGERTAAGHPLLLQSTHGDFSGTAQPYEAMLLSAEGWHVRGFALLGTPVPRTGHNERIAWAHTASSADGADAYEVTFDHPDDPLLYRFDGEWRRAVEWQDTLQVNSPAGVQQRVFTFRRTHHGPVVTLEGTRGIAVRVARMSEGGSLQQAYAMGRATDLDAFRAALDARALVATATVYADVDGNIFHVHGSAVPVRDTLFDWTRPVDGASSRTEWRGYHALDELPQRLNPEAGRVAAPHALPAGGAPYPDYMVSAAMPPAPAAAQRLAAHAGWTLAEWSTTAFDGELAAAGTAIAGLVAEWEQIGGLNPARARRLDGAIDLLRSWDHATSAESPEATLFVLWQERLRSGEYAGDYAQFRALEAVAVALERDWGSTSVAWGEVNRLQRVAAGVAFSDEAPSQPAAGVPAWAGSMLTLASREQPDGRRRYGVAGVMAVTAIELAPAVQARTVVIFGQSADPASPHHMDQAALYLRGELKRAPFTRAEVQAAARRVYRPGVAAVQELP